MAHSSKTNLFDLIRIEIDLGFTFLDTYRLSSSMGHTEHAAEAFTKAETAWDTATRFTDLLTEEEADLFRSRLQRLKSAIEAVLNRP